MAPIYKLTMVVRLILGSPFWGFSDSLCYNLIHGAWTDALVVGPPAQDWIRVASCPFPVH
jgi:hypothetical protein